MSGRPPTVPPVIIRIIKRLQIRILLIWQRHLGSVCHLLLVLFKELGVDLHLGRSEGGSRDEFLNSVSNVRGDAR